MLLLVGLNHRSAPLELRERLALTERKLEEALRELAAEAALDEVCVVSTCNRFEVFAEAEDTRAARAALREFIVRRDGQLGDQYERYVYEYEGRRAIRHLFRVASGLDSMILGEPQITGQVKGAYREAKRAGCTGTIVERALQQALATAKRVRSETAISRNPVSVAFAAVELARQIFGNLSGASALLLGAGKMSALVARHLAGRGVRPIVVASRTFTSAQSTAQRIGGVAANWDEGLDRLADIDIVVSGTGAADRVLGVEQVRAAARRRRGRPLFLVDIAVPRDIDPAVNRLDNVYLYDIDGLQDVIDTNLEARREAARAAEDLVNAEVGAFVRWIQSKSVAPTISAVQDALQEVGTRELERLRRKLGPLEPQQLEALDALVRGIAHKIAHRPIRRLRRAVERGEVSELIQLYEEIFDLERHRPGDEAAPTGPRRVIEGGKQDG